MNKTMYGYAGAVEIARPVTEDVLNEPAIP
jgi:hypothetical protein